MRRILLLLPGILAPPTFLIIGRTLPDDLHVRSLVMIVIGVSLGILLIQLAINFLAEIWTGTDAHPHALEKLRRVMMTASQSGVDELTSMTVDDWANYEDRLQRGDKVLVLTHDLYMYDCVPAAREVIVDNLLEGVEYSYFLAPEAENMHHDLCQMIVEDITERLARKSESPERIAACLRDVDQRITFRRVRQPLLYSFSVTRRRGQWSDTHWYAATPTSTPVLAVLKIKERDQIRVLTDLFDELPNRLRSASLAGIKRVMESS